MRPGSRVLRKHVSSPRRDAVLLGLVFGFSAMGSSATAIALPGLSADLGVDTGQAVWAISLYALALGVATALWGRLSDLFGVRRPAVAGSLLMGLGALTAAAAPAFPVVLAGRLVQGTGAAAFATLGITILSRRYAGRDRTTALALLAGTSAAVTGLGPLLGGVVTDLLGWRAVLALPVLGLLVLPGLWRGLDLPGSHARLDPVGAVLVAATAAGLVLVVQSPSTGAAFAVAGALLLVLGIPATTRWVRRVPEGFLPREVVGNASVVRSALVAASIPACWFALLVAAPTVLESHGWSPWQVGLVVSPGVLVALVMPRVSGPLLTRLGPARALVTSAALCGGAVLLSALGLALVQGLLLATAVVVLTFSFGLGQPAMGVAVGEATPERVRGVAMGVATLLFLVGGSVGAAVVGGLTGVTGAAVAMAVLATLPLAGVLVQVRAVRAGRAATGSAIV
jgi:MFS family permease